MNALLIILRLIHIVGGVLWVGTALLNTFFLAPTVAATAEAGQKFMGHLVTKARLTARVTLASYLTLLSGACLYWIDSQGFTSAWQSSGPGVGFGLGAAAGFIGLGFGQLVGKNATLVARLAGQTEGTPSLDQSAAIQKAQTRMTSAGRISTSFLIVSLVLMATARYWHF
ncbi:MAG: hypothetical protein V1755_01980 [Chloroflexota bacterium]